MTKHTTREAWLQDGAERMAEWFKAPGINPVPPIRVSCAWAKRASKRSIGWCWQTSVSADGVNELQVSPELDDPVKVLGVLLHEMIHASDNCASSHKGYFRTTALALGLTGKMTATTVGEELYPKLEALAAELGPYPHAALRPVAQGRVGGQTTRMIKVICPRDGYTLRTTRKWIDLGLPSCPCGEQMELS